MTTSGLDGVKVAVITVSDRCARGEAVDTAGPAVAHALTRSGAQVTSTVVADGFAHVSNALARALNEGAQIVLTAGGTGVAERDLTPDATESLIAQPLPGIMELLRATGRESTPFAALSRGLAGLTAAPRRALIVNLPGSERGARESVTALLPLLPHLLDQLAGGDHS